MARNKVRDYLEPWTATQDSTWKSTFRTPPVLSEYIDQDYINKWLADRDKASENAHWYIWGARMVEPSVTFDYQGRAHIWDGKGILAFTRNLGAMPNAPSHEDACKRACECVNACKAIAEPGKLISDVRGLLLDIVKGDAGPDDPRILSCLGRLIPAEELKQFQEDE